MEEAGEGGRGNRSRGRQVQSSSFFYPLQLQVSEGEAGYFCLLEGKCWIQEPTFKPFFLSIKVQSDVISQRFGFFFNYLGLKWRVITHISVSPVDSCYRIIPEIQFQAPYLMGVCNSIFYFV